MFIVHTISPCWHRIFLCFFGGILEGFLRKHQGFGSSCARRRRMTCCRRSGRLSPSCTVTYLKWWWNCEASHECFRMLPDYIEYCPSTLGLKWPQKETVCLFAVPLPLRKSNVGSKAGADGFHSRDEGGCTQCMLLLLWWLRARAEQHWLCSTGEGWGKKSEVRAGENYKE